MHPVVLITERNKSRLTRYTSRGEHNDTHIAVVFIFQRMREREIKRETEFFFQRKHAHISIQSVR